MKKVALIITLIISIFAFSACNNSKKADVQINIVNILEAAMNAPNIELFDLMCKPDNLTLIGVDGEYNDEPSEYDHRRDELYKFYFTDDAYKSFINQGYDVKYHYACFLTGQLARVSGISTRLVAERKYEFEVTSEYGLLGGEKVEIVTTGYAKHDENGKIEILVIDGQLLHELNKIEQDLSRLPDVELELSK